MIEAKSSRCCNMSKRAKIITIVVIVLALLLLGLSLGLFFALRPKVEARNQSLVSMNDGSVLRLTEVHYFDRNLFEDNV